jgi:ABC-type branched-subunit amino acid transport system ATPase component
VRLDDHELSGLSTHRIVRRSVGYVPEDRDVFTGLTVAENLRLAERIAVMHHGSLLACDTPAAVMANPTVQSAYLGEAL